MIAPFTLISNPSEDAMTTTGRTLERTSRSPKNKTQAQPATLVLANGGDASESVRVGLSLLGAGITGVSVGVLEGMARKGKVKWYREMTPGKKATLMLALFFAAGLTARWRRKQGDYKGACALEAVAIAAFTIASVHLTEAMVAGEQGELKGLGLLDGGADAALAKLSPDQLDKLDSMLDDDIRAAAAELRRMGERGALMLPVHEGGGDVAGLNTFGAMADEADDDLDF